MPISARLIALALVAASVAPASGCAYLAANYGPKHEGPAAPVAMTQDEADVFNQTNAYRVANHLPELKPDARLVALARQRSRDMASRDYFGHVTPEGADVFSTMREERLVFWAAGENLARNNYPAATSVTEAMEGWRKSPEHRANLLHPAFGHLGVGVATAKDGKRYFTQVFTD